MRHGGEAGALSLGRVTVEPPPHRADNVDIQYLGVGGVFVRWRGASLLLAPFFSNYPYASLLSGAPATPDIASIRRGLVRTPLDKTSAILVGHSHYDHLADVPYIAEHLAPEATIYTNRTGFNLLAGEPSLKDRRVTLEGLEAPVTLNRRLRFTAVASGHAPNIGLPAGDYTWADGTVDEPTKTPLSGQPISNLAMGQPYAFLIDCLDQDGEIAFRIHYQDAASPSPLGYPPEDALMDRGVDLAILPLPGRETLPESRQRFPEGLLRVTHARHALLIHYEDFFETSDTISLLPNLTQDVLDDYFAAITRVIRNPSPPPCERGKMLCRPAFTLPLPGAWLSIPVASP